MGIINTEVKGGGMPRIVLGDSRKGSECLHSTTLYWSPMCSEALSKVLRLSTGSYEITWRSRRAM